MNKNFKAFVFGASLVAGGLFAAAIGSLTTFSAGTPIKSSEVNGNFSVLKTAVEALEAPIGVSRLEVGGSPADGKVLKLEGGSLAWADDLIGSGGAASYSAGTGLALSGTTFSIGNGGVGTAQLGNTAVTLPKLDIAGSAASGSFLGYNGSKLEWQTPAAGSSSVQTDSTLKGNGTSGDRLGLRLPLLIESNLNTGVVLAITSQSTATPIRTIARGGTAAIEGTSTTSAGIVGRSDGSNLNTAGVKGENNSNTGQVVGVMGEAVFSPIGTGVSGLGSVTGGFFRASGGPSGGITPVGVNGEASGTSGTGVVGKGSATGGYFQATTSAGRALMAVANSNNSTFRLEQAGSGALIDGVLPSGNFFFVLNNGDVRASGDVISKGVRLTSDRNAKANFKTINSQAVLDKVARLSISRWNYKSDATSVQHIGPMAQDFHAAFGLNGSDDKHLSAVDVQGVALAAIQGLNQKLEQEVAQRKALEQQNADLKNQMLRLEERLSALEQK